jgi:hypothetical protein
MGNKELRTFWAASAFIILVLSLGAVLIYVEIPAANKDLCVSIISMLVGATGVAVGKLLGEEPEGDAVKLREQLEESELRFATLKSVHQSMVQMLVDRHIIRQTGIE